MLSFCRRSREYRCRAWRLSGLVVLWVGPLHCAMLLSMEGMVTRPSAGCTLTPKLSYTPSSTLSRWMRTHGQRHSTHVLRVQPSEHEPHSARWPQGSMMTVATLSEHTAHTPIRATSPPTGTRVGWRRPKAQRLMTKRPIPAEVRSSSCSCAAMAASDTPSSGQGASTAADCATSASHSTTHDDSAVETRVHSLAASQSSEHGSDGSCVAGVALSAVHSPPL